MQCLLFSIFHVKFFFHERFFHSKNKGYKKDGTIKVLFLLFCWRSDNKLCFAVVLKKKKRNKKIVDSLLFLSTLRELIFPWILSRKFITWAKCVTLTILAKTPKKIDKYFQITKSNLPKNFFTHLKHFLTFLLFVFIEK